MLKQIKLANNEPTGIELKNLSKNLNYKEDPQGSITKESLQHTPKPKMALAARSMVAKFGVMTEDLPIKLTSITSLERDGSNYQHWELEFQCYVGFNPDVGDYVTKVKQSINED